MGEMIWREAFDLPLDPDVPPVNEVTRGPQPRLLLASYGEGGSVMEEEGAPWASRDLLPSRPGTANRVALWPPTLPPPARRLTIGDIESHFIGRTPSCTCFVPCSR